MKKNNKKITKIQTEVTLDGMMTFSKLENGLHTADFQCCEDVKMETYIAKCKVQCMRDGNVYLEELPKRVKNKALFRDDNCSLSLGRNDRYYFVFSIDASELGRLPGKLLTQSSMIAHKVMQELILKK